MLYGAGWHGLEDIEYFNHNSFGLYHQALIYPVKMAYKSTILPQLKNLLDNETYEKMYEEIMSAKYLQQIDEAVHSRLHGLEDWMDLYSKLTLRGHLKKIKVPTLHIAADDDQIFEQIDKVPIDEALAPTNENVLLCQTSRGNHVCHLYGYLWPKQWISKPCFEFLNYLRDQPAKQKRI